MFLLYVDYFAKDYFIEKIESNDGYSIQLGSYHLAKKAMNKKEISDYIKDKIEQTKEYTVFENRPANEIWYEITNCFNRGSNPIRRVKSFKLEKDAIDYIKY